MTNRRSRAVVPATTPITPGVGQYPGLETFLDDDGPLAQDMIDKLNAGGRLLYALYHHPQSRELFTSPLMTPALLRAYMAAQKAWGL